MKKQRKRHDYFLLLLLVLLAALVGSLFDFGLRNERRIKEDVYETLGEASRQQIVLLETKLEDLYSQLRVLSDAISENDLKRTGYVTALMDSSAQEYGMFGIGLVDAASGVAQLNSGESFDASGRSYYQQAVQGESSIEYVQSGQLTGVEVIVLAVPVYRRGNVEAVLFASYDTTGFARLLETCVFSGRSDSYVMDARGRVIVGSNTDTALLPGSSALDFFASARLERDLTATDIAAKLRGESELVFSYATNGEERFAALTPTGVNGWSMLYLASGDVVAERTSGSSLMVYALALKLLCVFAVFTISLWLRERRNQRAIALREEEYRVAADHSEKVIMRYDIRHKTIIYAAGHEPENASKRTLTEGVPESTVAAGLVAEESVADYYAFYAAMQRGEPSGTKVFRMRSSSEEFAWYRADYTLISGGRTPRYAIISYHDVTRQREQELVYENWRQSLRERDPQTYSFYRCSVSEDRILEAVEGLLIPYIQDEERCVLSARTADYAQRFIWEEDREHYLLLMDRKSQLARYAQGQKTDSLEYRELLPDGGVRWLRVSVDLIGFSYSNDVECFLLFENIDAAKRAELDILERAETDPLTGVLNRATFAKRVSALIAATEPDTQHALLMVDVDGFKLVNDVFGHGAGDETLVELAEKLRGSLRRGDLVGRLGGDEFVVFLADIPGEEVAAKKAGQICELTRKSFGEGVQISASVGVALYPRDGDSFETLYKKADDTLYYVKASGKNNFAFYHSKMDSVHSDPPPVAPASVATPLGRRKRLMLIVDDNKIDHELLEKIFESEYRIEKAAGGSAALTRLRHYGSAVSVVLLDLMMPEMDGFEVLAKMQQSAVLKSVPVVVVSGMGRKEAGREAIRAGAADFVVKPIDPDLLRKRVQSAVSKAENERLRAHNSYLEQASHELSVCKTVLDREGVFVIENDWGTGTFTYGATVAEHLAGRYDQRPFWRILLSDLVASAQTVREMQQLAHDVANDRSRTQGRMTALLKTASGKKRAFEMNVYKTVNEYALTDKLLLTFRELPKASEAQAPQAL